MKKMTTKWMIALVLILAFATTSLKAQEWSKDQKEVWSTVNEYWSMMGKGDIEGFLSYFNEGYSGWSNDSPVPHSKDDTRKFFNFFFKGMKVPFYSITPVAVKVFDNVAVVHYYYMMVTESADGKKKSEEGRWTDILMKQGGKWLMIGDHGGEDEED